MQCLQPQGRVPLLNVASTVTAQGIEPCLPNQQIHDNKSFYNARAVTLQQHIIQFPPITEMMFSIWFIVIIQSTTVTADTLGLRFGVDIRESQWGARKKLRNLENYLYS